DRKQKGSPRGWPAEASCWCRFCIANRGSDMDTLKAILTGSNEDDVLLTPPESTKAPAALDLGATADESEPGALSPFHRYGEVSFTDTAASMEKQAEKCAEDAANA
ncbi:unnamed protein product, partial [Chrysoparadoxa australica]